MSAIFIIEIAIYSKWPILLGFLLGLFLNLGYTNVSYKLTNIAQIAHNIITLANKAKSEKYFVSKSEIISRNYKSNLTATVVNNVLEDLSITEKILLIQHNSFSSRYHCNSLKETLNWQIFFKKYIDCYDFGW